MVKGKVNLKKVLIALVIMAILEFVLFYNFIPAISVFSVAFWIMQAIFVVIFLFVTVDVGDNGVIRYNNLTCAVVVLAVVSVVVFAIGSIMSLELFNAKKYASLITVEDREFSTDLPPMDTVSNIALMDTSGAMVVGQRAIGSLSDVISQYQISEEYSTIDFNGEPMKVAPLEYAGLFKWFNNRKEGIPGYVLVDPVNFDAKYVKLEKSIKYSRSGWFGDNLERHLRFKYPTAIFGGFYFEIDNEGNPYYICPVVKPRVGMFGAYDVSAVVICDPCTGKTDYYKTDEVPTWVDRVYDGDLATQKYDWHGILSGGYINSIIGQEGCKRTTDDYGYKVMDGDVWVYTGVTSVIGDESNVGFILINARTCETIYYSIAGAEEYSAMEAAEGQVQNLGYNAAFPSLVNVDGEPTYLMVLKDKSNLVKMYAMVNMQKYSIVATGTTQRETLNSYRKLLKTNNIQTESNDNVTITKKVVVENIQYINIEGETYAYIIDSDGIVYKQLFEENESLIFIRPDDEIQVEYEASEDGINWLVSYKK